MTCECVACECGWTENAMLIDALHTGGVVTSERRVELGDSISMSVDALTVLHFLGGGGWNGVEQRPPAS